MKRVFIIAVLLLAVATIDAQKPLRKAFKDKFLIGAALNTQQVKSNDKKLLLRYLS
jgi:endo-1,4-beta-xylanase